MSAIYKKSYQKGQVALIALLVLTIATTVGLSLIARSITDISVSRDIEESLRAFSAAEAGVEEALRSGVASAPILDQQLGIQYTTTVASISATAASPLIFSKKTQVQHTETVWLVNHASDVSVIEVPTYTASSLDVCWSSESTTPALVVTLLYKESSDGSYRVAKGAYDPDITRAAVNSFSAPTVSTGGCGPGTNTTYKQTIAFSSFSASVDPVVDTLISLRVRPVYSATQMVLRPAQSLPFQGNKIESVGKTDSGVQRKIIVYQQYKSVSSVFDAALFSEESFVHQ